MTSRVLIAGLLGAIAMFIWSTVAHVVLPLGEAGISQIPNEAPVIAAMQSSIGDRDGLYFYPWVDPKDPNMMQKSAELMKTNPSGLLLYHPPGHGKADMMPLMVQEFVKQLIIALIAAWLLSMTVIATFVNRVVFVTAIGVAMALSTNASYWIWYGFPLHYTLAYMLIEVVEMLFAGVAIAWWFGRKPA